MRLARTTSLITFLQGITPLSVFGAWRSGGWLLLVAAGVYTILAFGLWSGRRWSLVLGFALSLPQLLIVNSWLVSWRFFVGPSLGPGVELNRNLLAAHIYSYYQFGVGINYACLGHSLAVASTLGFAAPAFVCFNVVAGCVTGLLAALLVRQRRTKPNQALQVTAGGSSAPVQIDA